MSNDSNLIATLFAQNELLETTVSSYVRRMVKFVTIRMGSWGDGVAAKLLPRFIFEGSENGTDVFFWALF